MSRLLLLCTCLVALTACDSTSPTQGPGVPPPSTAPLRVASQVAFFDDGGLFSATLRNDAGIESFSNPADVQDAALSTSRAGLWAGGMQEGQERTSIVYFDQSNFSSDCGTGQDRLFALDADTTYTDTEAWPRDIGAPVTTDGSPRVYGDQMLWGTFCSVPVIQGGTWADRFADPLTDLRLNMALYRYERTDLEGVRFIRYELTNTGTNTISDLRVGHFSDTETPGLYPSTTSGANIARYGSDAVGFDLASGLTYDYQLPFTSANHGPLSSTWVSGYTFLDTPGGAPLLSHRIIRRETGRQPEGFNQGPASATEALRALDGLSYDGDSMIDPTTGAPAMFAFHTNPFEQATGWLDSRDSDGSYRGVHDIRQLLSAGPSSLAPGETVVLTVVVVTAETGTSSADSYQQVQQTLSSVRAEPSLWRFTE